MNHFEMFSVISGKDQQQSQQIMEDLGGVHNIGALDIGILENHPRLTKKQAQRIWAAFHLGRISILKKPSSQSITSPQLAYEEVQRFLTGKQEEALVAIYLNRRRTIIQTKLLTKGSEAYTIVDPRQIFHYAVQCRSSGIILAHNHPSGDPNPSKQDLDITERLVEIGHILHIPLLDHLILGTDSFISLTSLGVI